MQLKNYSKESRQFKKRIVKAAIAMTALGILLIIRLFSLQILNHDRFAKSATDNQLAHIAIEPNRGLIYDRNGVLLAENRPIFTLNLVIEYVKDIDNTINELRKILNITDADLAQFHKCSKNRRNLEQIPLKQKLTMEEVATFYVNNYKFPGVTIDTSMYRYYPRGEELAHVVGYVGKINREDLKKLDGYTINEVIGKVGIEKYYESLLHGKTGYKVVETGATGKITRPVKIIQPVAGKTIYLTIDSKLQQVARDALGKEKGAAVVIDPRNGEVLALVSNPSYDPNLFTQGIASLTFDRIQNSPQRPLYNRATKGQFPFASTIKPFLALQALDTHIINTNFKVNDPGWFKLEGSSHIYRDWQLSGRGMVDVRRAIRCSSDVFFYTLSIKMGIASIANILERFGFGSITQIDLAEESPGIVATPQWKRRHKKEHWYLGDTVISSIGQGSMTTTPLQLAQGVAAIAMHGKRFKPHLLKSVRNHNGNLQEIEPTPLEDVKLKNPELWDFMISAMCEVIRDPEGTAHRRFEGWDLPYSVAGKTGEAQLYRRPQTNMKLKVPKHLLNHNSFISFAPVEAPQIAVAVISENSNLAIKITRKILDHYLVAEASQSKKTNQEEKTNEDEETNEEEIEEESNQSDSN